MSSRRLVWTERAIADLEAIERYIAADDPVAAARWIDRLLAATTRVARLPMSGRIVPELGRADVRETRLRSYRIVYRATKDRVEVLTVFEGHRRFPTGAIRAKR
jgi:toxin ParE1/3/4